MFLWVKYIIIIAIMISRNHPMHLEIQKHNKNYYGILRTSYREDGKVKHTTHGRLKGVPLHQLKLIQAALRGDAIALDDKAAPKVSNSKEYGAVAAVLQLAKELELDKAIYSKPEKQWVKDSLAMIVGRLVYAGSKLSLSNRYKDTALWELCGVEGKVDVDEHCYKVMDKLLQRQAAIQEKLAAKHLDRKSLVLYDITSSYFEGEYEGSNIVKFGYNRDKKKGHEQMVIGLICNSQGCPVGVEVFPGNTKDETTVVDKVAEIKERYQVEELIFVGDRGMVTRANTEKLKGVDGLNTISALTHHQIKELLERRVIQTSMFDEKEIVEIIDPDKAERRYCLCRNPLSAERETKTRKALLEKTATELDKIANSNRKSTPEKIAARVGKVLARTRMGKFVNWTIVDNQLQWHFKEDAIDTEQLLDGCYIISSDVPQDQMDKQELVLAYKKLTLVENAFRNLKTVQIEVRPVFHKTDERIRCHVFLCMLAYYLQWHMNQRLVPLFSADGKHKERFWTFENVIERLKSVRREEIHMAGSLCKVVTQLDADQKKIAKLLNVKL